MATEKTTKDTSENPAESLIISSSDWSKPDPEDMKLDPHYFPMCEPPQRERLFKPSSNKNEES